MGSYARVAETGLLRERNALSTKVRVQNIAILASLGESGAGVGALTQGTTVRKVAAIVFRLGSQMCSACCSGLDNCNAATLGPDGSSTMDDLWLCVHFECRAC